MADFNRRQVVRGLCGGVAGALLAPAGLAVAVGTIPIDDKSVLIVVDLQNCFLPGGSLEVKDGDKIVPIIS
jgi:nicotinamidase/pyrazinamidase